MATWVTLVSLYYELHMACPFEWLLDSEGESDVLSPIRNTVKDPCMSPSTRMGSQQWEKKLILKRSLVF